MKVGLIDKNLWKNYLAILGVIGIFANFITIPENYKFWSGIIFLTTLIFIFIFLLYKANCCNKAHLNINGLKIKIFYGDLFLMQGLKLIPFNEYFDTLVDNVVVAEKSLHGQFIKTKYQKVNDLDGQIITKLKGKKFKPNKSRNLGKKKKYGLGTTIEIADEYLLTAFTRFDDENKAHLSKIDYLTFLDKLWNEVNRIYAQRDINIPLIGSGISRIGSDLKCQDYLYQIINSLKLSNLDNFYDTNINIILHKSVKDKINLFEIKSNF